MVLVQCTRLADAEHTPRFPRNTRARMTAITAARRKAVFAAVTIARRRRRGALCSARDAVAHVGDTVFALEDSGALQLDVLGTKVFELAAPLAE